MSIPMMSLDNKTKAILRDPVKRRIWVKYQCQLRHVTMSEIATEAGVTRACFYSVFNKTYPRMEKVLADFLGLEPAQLFPERYDKDGLPIYRMGRPKKSISNGVHDNTRSGYSNVHSGQVV